MNSHEGAPSVGIVIGGRFVAFDIARELLRRQRFGGMTTAYPRAMRERIPLRQIRWRPDLGLRAWLARRYTSRPQVEVNYEHDVRFGRWAARHLPDADVIQAWTGYALESIRAGRARGSTMIAFRASTHIEAQAALVQEEFTRFGLSAPSVSARNVERELEEYASADFVNVVSTFAARSFVARGFPAGRLINTPLAVDVAEVTSAERREAARGPLRVLFLGTICLRKGVQYLIEAVRLLPPGEVSLSLVGGIAPDGEILLSRVGGREHLRGKRSRAELAALFAEHDVLVIPSVEDGSPAVIGEAMAAGLCTIGTPNSGIEDLVVDGVSGYVVPVRSPEALAARLQALADDRATCLTVGATAATAARQGRTWSRFVDELLSKYAAAHALIRGRSSLPTEAGA